MSSSVFSFSVRGDALRRLHITYSQARARNGYGQAQCPCRPSVDVVQQVDFPQRAIVNAQLV